MDWTTLQGKPPLPYVEALRLALVERLNKVTFPTIYNPLIARLADPIVSEAAMTPGFAHAFQSMMSALFGVFVDYRTAASWNGLSGTVSASGTFGFGPPATFAPMWTEANLLSDIGDAERYLVWSNTGGLTPPTASLPALYPFTAAWAKQQYELLNRLRWTRHVPGASTTISGAQVVWDGGRRVGDENTNAHGYDQTATFDAADAEYLASIATVSELTGFPTKQLGYVIGASVFSRAYRDASVVGPKVTVASDIERAVDYYLAAIPASGFGNVSEGVHDFDDFGLGLTEGEIFLHDQVAATAGSLLGSNIGSYALAAWPTVTDPAATNMRGYALWSSAIVKWSFGFLA
jgi:hypothetical protein